MNLYSVPDDNHTPFPASYDRMRHTLADMGYHIDEVVEGRASGAVFDSIPFLFTFDASERFMSVRALWDTALPATQHSADVFAILDEWNREKYFPTLYWIPNDDGTIQVCADFVVDTIAGLSVDQMKENLGAGISTGIAAIEYTQRGVTECLGMPAHLATSPSGGAAFGLA